MQGLQGSCWDTWDHAGTPGAMLGLLGPCWDSWDHAGALKGCDPLLFTCGTLWLPDGGWASLRSTFESSKRLGMTTLTLVFSWALLLGFA